jgi:hypothetical protein
MASIHKTADSCTTLQFQGYFWLSGRDECGLTELTYSAKSRCHQGVLVFGFRVLFRVFVYALVSVNGYCSEGGSGTGFPRPFS